MKKNLTMVQDSVEIKEYVQVLLDIKSTVAQAQVKAMLAANQQLLFLYWDIGKMLTEKMKNAGWGAKIVDKLSADLQREFPEMKGFSRENIYRMVRFYDAYAIVSQAVTQLESLSIFQIPWGHNVLLMVKIKNNDERLWYAQKTIDNGWSRNVLEHQIGSDLYHRQGKAITNFSKTLPAPHSDLAQQVFKDPYIFDFLSLQEQHLESDLEKGMVAHVQKLLLEMGKGFAFIDRQYHVVVAGQDYYIDLLFYHVKLRCFVVVELKARAFQPADAGQVNFYLSAIDDVLKSEHDNPTIALVLCKEKNDMTVEYALRRSNSPIGVAQYEIDILHELPKDLRSSLPTIDEIEIELAKYDILAQGQKK